MIGLPGDRRPPGRERDGVLPRTEDWPRGRIEVGPRGEPACERPEEHAIETYAREAGYEESGVALELAIGVESRVKSTSLAAVEFPLEPACPPQLPAPPHRVFCSRSPDCALRRLPQCCGELLLDPSRASLPARGLGGGARSRRSYHPHAGLRRGSIRSVDNADVSCGPPLARGGAGNLSRPRRLSFTGVRR